MSRQNWKGSTLLAPVPPCLVSCGDMEKCCKEMEDYRGAYEFSNNKMEILEHMLMEM